MNQSTIITLNTLRVYTNQYRAATVQKILNESKYSYSKVYNDLITLCSQQLINRGIKQGIANTYYITEKGIDFLIKIKDLSDIAE